MKTGMSTACFFGEQLNEDALRIIGQAGINCAEIFFSSRSEYAPSFVSTLRDIADGEGVGIRSVHAMSTMFEPQLMSIHPRQFEEAYGIFHEVLQAANRLGAEVYVFHGPMYLKTARKLNIDFPRIGERLTQLAQTAASYGVKLCYETVHWCWYQSPAFGQQILRFTDSDNLRFTLDMKQAAQSGYSPIAYIDQMDGRLEHVHVCDFRVDPQKGIMPVLPFSGEAPWDQLRKKITQLNFDGTLMLEVYTGNYGSVQELMDCYKAVQEFFTPPDAGTAQGHAGATASLRALV